MFTTTITSTNPQGFKHIFRTDTNNYTKEDILQEIYEWEQILEVQTCMEPEKRIRIVEIHDRFTSTLASVGRKKNERYCYIKVNGNYLRTHTDPKNFHSTLAHEVVHTFPGCWNHQQQFKAIGRILMNTVPHVKINRTGGDAGYTKYMDKHPRKPSQIKWIATCNGCGQEIIRERRVGIIKEPQNYKCGRCGGRFKVESIGPDGIRRDYLKVAI